jgi:hypothetical protein
MGARGKACRDANRWVTRPKALGRRWGSRSFSHLDTHRVYHMRQSREMGRRTRHDVFRGHLGDPTDKKRAKLENGDITNCWRIRIDLVGVCIEWPEIRKQSVEAGTAWRPQESGNNARPKTNTRRQHENRISCTLDRSRRRAEFFTSGGAVEFCDREVSKTNARGHFRRPSKFFLRTHYRGEKQESLLGAKWPLFENRKKPPQRGQLAPNCVRPWNDTHRAAKMVVFHLGSGDQFP